MSCGNCGNGGCGGCGGCSDGCGSVDASQVILNPVPAGVRPCSPLSGTCGNPAPATPAPYYQCAPQCQENNCETVVYNNFATAICTTYSFVIPNCDQTVNVYFVGTTTLPVGAYLWDYLHGYFRVIAFNSQTGLATLEYQCLEQDNSGETVPACTCFVVTDPPASTPVDPTNPYVAANFTAPAIGDCTTISVTTIAGLTEGDVILIGSGSYTLDTIINSTTITICNTGDGITPGSIVEAQDSLGNLQYPIVVAGSCCSNILGISEELTGGGDVAFNLITGGTLNPAILSASYSNTSNTRVLGLQVTYEVPYSLSLTNAVTDTLSFGILFEVSVDSGPYAALSVSNQSAGFNPNVLSGPNYSDVARAVEMYSIPTNGGITLDFRVTLTNTSPDTLALASISRTRILAIGTTI